MRPSVLRFTTLTALAALAAGWGAPAAAQSASEVHSGIAVGAAPGRGRSGPGVALFGSAEVSRRASRLGARGELFYSHAGRGREGLSGVACDACSAIFPIAGARSTQDAFGALLGATFRLTDATRLRPYLLGGVGIYRTRTELRGTLSNCPPGAMCLLAQVVTPVRESQRGTGAGAHLGAGTALRVGQLDLTVEARYHVLDRAVGSAQLVPLTIGVRF